MGSRKNRMKDKVGKKEEGFRTQIPPSSPRPLQNIPPSKEQEYGDLLPHEFLLPYGTLPTQKVERRDPMKMRKGADLLNYYVMDSTLSITPEERAVVDDFKAILGENLYPIIKERFIPSTKVAGFIVEKDRIAELWIYNCGLTEIPGSIGQLTALKRLILWKNKLEEIPSSIGNMVNLQELNLSENRLSKLPSAIGDLLNLRDLDLAENHLRQVPPSLGRLSNLRKLILANNGLKEVSAVLEGLVNLVELDLSYNNLGWEDASIERLKKLKLKKLYLAGCHLEEVPAALGELTDLEELDLSYNYLEQIPVSLSELKALKIISLHGNKHLEFPEFLERLPNLVEVDLIWVKDEDYGDPGPSISF
jgi:Leucine-rich repeat (LRR) protein